MATTLDHLASGTIQFAAIDSPELKQAPESGAIPRIDLLAAAIGIAILLTAQGSAERDPSVDAPW